MSDLGTRTINPNERLFRPLSNLMFFLSAIAHTLVAVGKSKIPLAPGTFYTLQSDVAERQVLLPGYGPLEDAIENRAPQSFALAIRAANLANPITPMAQLPGYSDQMVAAIFILHFEICRAWLDNNSRGDTSKWPMPIDFARNVRNAVAHGGCLEIKQTKKGNVYRTVSWGKLSYSISDHGRRILGTDIFGPDLVALMIEVDDELVALGAPR